MSDFKDVMPEGLAFSMALNEQAMLNFSRMSESERDEIINRGKNVKSKKEMERFVDSIAKKNM